MPKNSRRRAPMGLYIIFIFSLLLAACGGGDETPGPVGGTDFRSWQASRVFSSGGIRHSPADFDDIELSYLFDVPNHLAPGVAKAKFRVRQSGKVYFLSNPTVDSLLLDGRPATFTRRMDPDGLTPLLVIDHLFREGEEHEITVGFHLPDSAAGFHAGGVAFLTSMSDFPGGNYLEAYAPIGFEDDAVKIHLNIELVGANAPHHLYANGEVTQPAENQWRVEFPAYFHSSSFFLHFTDTAFEERRLTVHGLEKEIPVTVYSKSSTDADEAAARLPELFAELEGAYGPFPHATFTAYIYGRGGMEHSGATVTSVSALGHELTHSWFARGVMPADGRSGWIDEAVASWRDHGYFRATAVGARAPTNLGRFSAFQRFTTPNCYADGRALLAELDLLFAGQGGLRPFLRDLFGKWKYKSIHNDDFEAALVEYAGKAAGGTNIDALFQKYVYAAGPEFHDPSLEARTSEPGHPRPYTAAELRDMR